MQKFLNLNLHKIFLFVKIEIFLKYLFRSVDIKNKQDDEAKAFSVPRT